MAAPTFVEVRGYRVAVDRRYDADTHMWVKPTNGRVVRIGLDPLGVETSGTLAQLSFVEAGEELARGRAFGQLEAAKFVGPLVSPLSGTVSGVNDAVMAHPGRAELDPYGAGWLIELVPSRADDEFPLLLHGAEQVTEWFAHKVDEYRLRGVIVP